MILFNIVDDYVLELCDVVPASEDHQQVLLAHDLRVVAASCIGRRALRFWVRPFVSFAVKNVEISEGLRRVADAAVSSEDVDLAFVKGR